MANMTLKEWVQKLDDAGLLNRITDETRVDELPQIMEDNPSQAVLVENVKDCQVPFLSNAYATEEMFTLALGCTAEELPAEIARRKKAPRDTVTVQTSPLKDNVITGDDLDLAMLPWFCHHEHDGHAFINDCNVVSRNLGTGLLDTGEYRLQWRKRNETGISLSNPSRNTRLNIQAYVDAGREMPVACVIGGTPHLKLSQMYTVEGYDDWQVLGGLLGEPVELVKCETNDLMVPASADIVLEGRMMVSEGPVHDEGPYGEYMVTYGGGLQHMWRIVWDCITHRNGAIYEYASIAGLHPGRSDMVDMTFTLAADIYDALKSAAIDVVDLYLPPDAVSQIAYLKIRPHRAGDANNALALMLTCSRQMVPKIAYVFDDDVDIRDPGDVSWAFGLRFNPEQGTLILPRQNVNFLDPSLTTSEPPFFISKIGFDCTKPTVGDLSRFDRAVVVPPAVVPDDLTILDTDQLTDALEKFIRQAPRAWREVVAEFAGHPYPALYHAFGRLRDRLGRREEDSPTFPYRFIDTGSE
ncbi:hypothetical protein MMAD_18220 [Mycolicibacterium madagascariense]|uniref:UbiD family decarboxylase n=1 Tax=Mycolicibacterium madagascariense TaxID=212765 RepID=A0A7I7XEC9_9MYCO|nr:UbiD family decarboxylase [Mycolicibacterium madagascariense]MCV7015234.1 UbiD family decarboxylase [Mycolicibacterium madagascariense]BBZ27527.1 hypothetical protein MMAD_18220 [Mycolicibacterium madagascariense]